MRAISMFTTDDNGALVVSTYSGEVAGDQLLLQKIVKFLLTIPGSNIIDPNYGSLLGDKAYLARMGNDISKVKLLIVAAIDSANKYFTTEKNFESMELSQLYVSEDDPTVFYAEIFVYFSGGKVYNITV